MIKTGVRCIDLQERTTVGSANIASSEYPYIVIVLFLYCYFSVGSSNIALSEYLYCYCLVVLLLYC